MDIQELKRKALELESKRENQLEGFSKKAIAQIKKNGKKTGKEIRSYLKALKDG